MKKILRIETDKNFIDVEIYSGCGLFEFVTDFLSQECDTLDDNGHDVVIKNIYILEKMEG